MALITPPGYLQAGTYDAVKDRQYLVTTRMYKQSGDNSRARSGLLPDLNAWSAPYSNTGFNITIGPFRAVISNTFAANAGDYIAVSAANESRTLTGSSPTTNRIDVVGVQVRDAFYSGAFNDVDVVVVQGTPAAGTPAVPTLPAGFLPFYQLAVNASSTQAVVTDVRKRTALVGSQIPIFDNQVGDAGVYFGEKEVLPGSGAIPARERMWGQDSAWHGITPYALDFGAYVLTSSTANRVIGSLSVADPGYRYKLVFSGAIWAGIDPVCGWAFNVRSGGSGGTIHGTPGAYETRDSVYNGTNSIPITGASAVLTGAITLEIWAQRKFGAGTQGLAVDPGTAVSVLVVPM
jgi:hypothetical protein